jgi:hypothetical protein
MFYQEKYIFLEKTYFAAELSSYFISYKWKKPAFYQNNTFVQDLPFSVLFKSYPNLIILLSISNTGSVQIFTAI